MNAISDLLMKISKIYEISNQSANFNKTISTNSLIELLKSATFLRQFSLKNHKNELRQVEQFMVIGKRLFALESRYLDWYIIKESINKSAFKKYTIIDRVINIEW